MTEKQDAGQLRSRKLGGLIKDARQLVGRSVEHCADLMQITPQEFSAYETGEKSPSLPQLEILAYDFQIPLEYFWEDLTQSDYPSPGKRLDLPVLVKIRNRMIATELRLEREGKQISLEEAAHKSGLDPQQLLAYENYQAEVPLHDLEALCAVYDCQVQDLWDKKGPVGRWVRGENDLSGYRHLTEELRSFISKPINRPYIEIAQRLSEMSVDKLRAVAEGLLEITL